MGRAKCTYRQNVPILLWALGNRGENVGVSRGYHMYCSTVRPILNVIFLNIKVVLNSLGFISRGQLI